MDIMKDYSLRVLLSLICFSLITPLFAEEVTELFWVDPDQVPPMTGEEIKDKFWTDKPFVVEKLYTTDTPRIPMPDGKLLIIVNDTLYDDNSSIQTSISNYIDKRESLGDTVTLWTAEYGTPEDLRSELQSHYSSEGYFTLLLVGEFPVPISEMEGDPYSIDLFFMDMDGNWFDNDSDGYYDNHTGDTAPEIAFGRLWASTLTYNSSNEVDLINDYFTKNLNYYNGGLSDVNRRALAFVDDDWFPWANGWGIDMGEAYDDVTTIADEDTIADIYEDYLIYNYESILICCHSNPNYHHFKEGEYWTGGYTWYYEIYDIEPVSLFFNLFACSNCEYTYSNCMGCWYILNPSDYCISAVGSSKSGSMLSFDYFYGPLGDGETYGEAFRQWFEDIGIDDKGWHYGMTLFGDPMLMISKHQTDIELVAFDVNFTDEGVRINWDIETDEEILGYNIYKREIDLHKKERHFDPYSNTKESLFYEWNKVNEEVITGETPFTYIDRDYQDDTTYVYKLHAVVPGTETLLGTQNITTAIPQSFAITSLYPNPTIDRLNVELTASDDASVEMRIYDIAGRVVKSVEVDGGESVEIDTSSLSSGVYTISAESDEGRAIERFVVAK